MKEDMPHDELMARLVSAQKGEDFDADRILEREQAYQDGWRESEESRSGPSAGPIELCGVTVAPFRAQCMLTEGHAGEYAAIARSRDDVPTGVQAVEVLRDALADIREFAAKNAPPAGDGTLDNAEPWYSFWSLANNALSKFHATPDTHSVDNGSGEDSPRPSHNRAVSTTQVGASPAPPGLVARIVDAMYREFGVEDDWAMWRDAEPTEMVAFVLEERERVEASRSSAGNDYRLVDEARRSAGAEALIESHEADEPGPCTCDPEDPTPTHYGNCPHRLADNPPAGDGQS